MFFWFFGMILFVAAMSVANQALSECRKLRLELELLRADLRDRIPGWVDSVAVVTDRGWSSEPGARKEA